MSAESPAPADLAPQEVVLRFLESTGRPSEARLYVEAMGSDVHDYLEDATADDAGHDTYVLDLTGATQ